MNRCFDVYGQLYYDCGLHFERDQAQEEEIELRIPRILAVMALT